MYQPTVDIGTGIVTGVEALLRWRHPQRGVVGPLDFVPALESTGLIVPVGRWVLDEACRQGAAWMHAGHHLTVSVNISANQLDGGHLVDDVRASLESSGFRADLLILELTETILMRDVRSTVDQLHRLKATGIRISIDDFGTGYSSLAYLRKFPIDILKIDQSFVSAIADTRESAAIVHTLVQLGKVLGLETVAEGIETIDQWSRLRAEDVDKGQGYLFARPLDVSGARPDAERRVRTDGDTGPMSLRSLVDHSKLRRILETTRLVEGDFELEVLLRHVVAEACSMTGAQYGALGVLNPAGDGLAQFLTVGLSAADEQRIGPRPVGLGLLGSLIHHPVPVMVDCIVDCPDRAGFPPHHPPMHSLVGVPVKVRGEVYGNLYLTDKFGGRPFDPEDLDLAEALALAAGIAIENARLHATLGLVAELRSDSRKDHLTGLANRRSWDERLDDELERSIRTATPVSVALLDLDDFKAVNDRGGHQAGDARPPGVRPLLAADHPRRRGFRGPPRR